MTSSMMQRPVSILERCETIDSISILNMKSALAYAALITPNGADESELYENIVEIP